MLMLVLSGILIPFIGTAIGSSFVYLSKDKTSAKYDIYLSYFAGGVMFAASVWSLLIPALSYGENKWLQVLSVVSGFISGVFILILTDRKSELIMKTVNSSIKLKSEKTFMQILAITVHNFPEGLAVGMIFAAALKQGDLNSFYSALFMSLGIAVQNIPEGAIVSFPLLSSGESRLKSFVIGLISGIVEPFGAITAILLSEILTAFMPCFMSFAAGAMIYVTVKQMSELNETAKIDRCMIFFTVGFLIMMSLDVVLS